MPAISSMIRFVGKFQPNMALRYLKPLRSSPLAPTRLIVRKQNTMPRLFSAVMTITITGHEHQLDVSSERLLSMLSHFGLWRDMPNDYTERKRKLGWSSQEAERREMGEAQTTAQ